jgi:hypothetical protein
VAEEKARKKWFPAFGLLVVLLMSFSNLFTFSDRIASKPSQAGFWMILIFGVCLGATAVSIPLMLRKPKK